MIQIKADLCTGCGLCVDNCPTDAIAWIDDQPKVDHALCDGCKVCVDTCPQGAIYWVETVERVPTGSLSLATSSKAIQSNPNFRQDQSSDIEVRSRKVEVITEPKKNIGTWLGKAFNALVYEIAPAVERFLAERSNSGTIVDVEPYASSQVEPMNYRRGRGRGSGRQSRRRRKGRRRGS